MEHENNADLVQLGWNLPPMKPTPKSTAYIEEAYDNKKGDAKKRKMQAIKNSLLKRNLGLPETHHHRPTMGQELGLLIEVNTKEFSDSLDFYYLADLTDPSIKSLMAVMGKAGKIIKKFNKEKAESMAKQKQLSIFGSEADSQCDVVGSKEEN